MTVNEMMMMVIYLDEKLAMPWWVVITLDEHEYINYRQAQILRDKLLREIRKEVENYED